MLNPRPALPFVVTVPQQPGACICFRTMQMQGNRVTFSGGKGGPASQLNLWRTGRRTFKAFQFLGPVSVNSTWTFTNAYPVKWVLSEFDASKNEVAIETLELAYEGLA